MKKVLSLIAVAITVLVVCCGCNQKPQEKNVSSSIVYEETTLKLSTTTSVNDSKLLDYLKPYLKDEENINLDVLAQGSGQAIQTAKDGNCDILISHSPAAEEEFISSGKGENRLPFMYNYFVIAGPINDKANVSSASSAKDSFLKIYNKYVFYSRDDKSGTDTKEKSIWKSANIDTTTMSDEFYKKTAKGMLDTLIMADNTDGYTLTDKATFLANKENLKNLKILLEKNDELKNIYSVILVKSSEKYEAAKRLQSWLLKPSTQSKIAQYGKKEYNEALFFVE